MKILKTILLISACSLLVIFLYILQVPPFPALEYAAYDFRYSLLPETSFSNDFLIIDIDDESEARIGPFPWSRAVDAELLDKLSACSPKAAAVNLIFADPSKDGFSNGTPDRALADAVARMKQQCPVILAYHLHNDDIPSENIPLKNPAEYTAVDFSDSPASSRPEFISFGAVSGVLPELAGNATKQAFSMIIEDNDGVVRRALLAAKFNNTTLIPLALATVNHIISNQTLSSTKDYMFSTQIGGQQCQFPQPGYVSIKFPFKKSFCPRISAWKILKNEFNPELIKDKILIIGCGASNTPKHSVPDGRALDGLEIQAATMETLMNQGIPLNTPTWGIGAGAIFTAVLTFLAPLILIPKNNAYKMLIFTAIFAGYTALNIHWFVHSRILINLSAPLLAFTANTILLNVLIRRGNPPSS